MGLDVVPTGDLNSVELFEKLQLPRPVSPTSSSSSPSPSSSPASSPASTHKSNNTNDYATAISRDGKIFAIGKYNLLLLFKVGGNWKITRLYEDESQQQPGEYVTQITILPLNKPQNPHCVIVGYSSGFIRLFGVNGVQYVAQKFHYGPVRRLVVCTSGMIDVGVMALYDGGVIASLTNFNLTDPLPNNNAADSPSSTSSIAYRKWQLFGMESVVDLLFVAPTNGAPAAGRVVATGRNPGLSFYTVTEDQNSSLSIAVALASTVASKLTSAVVSLAKNWWWGGSSGEVEQSEKEKVAKEKAKEKERDMAANTLPVSLSVRWGIYDGHRQFNSILEAPTTSLAAATDGFGRISLIDTRACVVVRMWKGYREAQCGWIVDEKKTLYLVIHAPRRGLLEVWKMRHGSRVSAQAIGSGWRLLPAVDNCYILDKNGVIHQLVIRE